MQTGVARIVRPLGLSPQGQHEFAAVAQKGVSPPLDVGAPLRDEAEHLLVESHRAIELADAQADVADREPVPFVEGRLVRGQAVRSVVAGWVVGGVRFLMSAFLPVLDPDAPIGASVSGHGGRCGLPVSIV